MDNLKTALDSLAEPLPAPVRDFLAAGGWWLLAGVLALFLTLLVEATLRRFWRMLFRRAPQPVPNDDLAEDLDDCPLPTQPPGECRLAVYHLPVRLRLIVVAPAGTETEVDALTVEKLLDHVVPGLAAVADRDRPRVRVWPAQVSRDGFVHAFFRNMRRYEPEGQPSRWVLVAGRATVGKRTLLLGLGLWADAPNLLGRVALESHQWLDVLRLKAMGEA